MRIKLPFAECLECGRTFATAIAAERAANNGCPKCNSVDIDVYNPPRTSEANMETHQHARQ